MVYESSESANNLLSYVASASTNHTSARRTLELWTCDNDGEGEAEGYPMGVWPLSGRESV